MDRGKLTAGFFGIQQTPGIKNRCQEETGSTIPDAISVAGTLIASA